MKFFCDYYQYEEVAPKEDSKVWIEQYEQIEKLGNEYIAYLMQISEYFPPEFLNIYFEHCQFQGWDLNKLEFDHDIYNYPIIKLTLTHTNINQIINLKYLEVKSFFTNLNEKYFNSYKFGKPGIIGVNEFNLNGDNLSHEIYFNSPENIKIYFKKLEISIDDI